MSDLQLSLFPASWSTAGAWLAGPPAATVTRLPGRVPASGAECLAVLYGTTVPFRLRRSLRARRLRILVERPAGLEVVLPERVPLREVEPALEENARWILRTLERCRSRPAAPVPRLGEGAEIRFLGRRLTVREVPPGERGGAPPIGRDEIARVWLEGDELRVLAAPLHPGAASEGLRQWLRSAAHREIPRRVHELGDELGFRVERLSVRDQRTKWGACSAEGSLTFNWRLSFAPPEVLDYVIVHELCHLRELNHSPRFWRLVRALRPGFEGERAWLRENGTALDV